jgi:hypothetical protein
MAKPNKAGKGAGLAVAQARRDRGMPSRKNTKSPFWEWFFVVVRAGRTFESVEQAQAEFEAESK